MRENKEAEEAKGPNTEMDQESGIHSSSAPLLLQLFQTYLEENKMLFKITEKV